MSLRRARSIDDLYSEVSEADIALSAEAPLTLALDRRITKPRIGRLAATPRSHATGDLVPEDRRELFIELVTETALSWKQASRALELCLDCWNRTGSVEAITGYDEFDTPAVRTTVDLLTSTESSYRTLDRSRISNQTSVTVIDEPSLSALDRQLLPENYETVSPFGSGTVSLPSVHIYPTATDIVETLVDQVDAETAGDIGIVLDQSSIYSSLVESAFETAGIPYQGGPGFLDADDVRVFLRLVQSAFTGSGLTVGQLRPLLTSAGFDVPRELDHRRIEYVEDAENAFTAAERFFETVRTATFETVLDEYEDTADVRLDTLRDELEELELSAKAVTEARINELVYYVQSFEVPVERERDGVLLTDAGSTAYVDRPVVFYLGLGRGWARTPPDFPWVDSSAFTTRDRRRFELLLQNGQQRYYLVQESRAGEEVMPCVYFRDLGGVETFDEFEYVRHPSDTVTASTSGFEAPEQSPSADRVHSVSQSTLKRLVNSPRDHYFDRLVDEPTNFPMERGNVLHEAAELYVNDSSVGTDRREELLDAMCDELQPYLGDTQRETTRTEIDVGLEVLTTYLSTHSPEVVDFDQYGEPDHENDLADRLDIDLESAICERWFRNEQLGGHGIVDLLQDARTLVDYKTGRPKSVADVEKAASLSDLASAPDFQVLLYLAHHRYERPDEQLRMRFVHLLGATHEIVKGQAPDLDELVTELHYVPWTFGDFVAQREVYDELTDYADSNPRRQVLDKLGYDRYREFFEAHELPRVDEAPQRRQEIREAFQTLAKSEIGDYAYVEEGTDKIFGDLEDTPAGYFTRGDIDAFEEFVNERLVELNQYRTDRFPVSFRDDGPNWDRVDHRDLILTGGETDE